MQPQVPMTRTGSLALLLQMAVTGLAILGFISHAQDDLRSIGGFAPGSDGPKFKTNRVSNAAQPAAQPVVLNDVRSIGGTNYYVHSLVSWMISEDSSGGFKTQPLPAWRFIRGTVLQVGDGGILVSIRLLTRLEFYPQRRSEINVGRSQSPDFSMVVRRDPSFGGLGTVVFLKNHPDQSRLIDGQGVAVLAMLTGNYTYTNTQGARKTVALFDYGTPVPGGGKKAVK
jgi:hypothetical protein